MKRKRTILLEQWREALASVLPIAGIVFVLCFTIVPVPNGVLAAYVIGTLLLIAGMGLFTLGADLAMMPIGQYVGSETTRSKRFLADPAHVLSCGQHDHHVRASICRCWRSRSRPSATL